MASSPPRGDIQGLRALAVGAVVLSHAGVPWLAGGFVGVDVFFVVSGFLITGLLVREVRSTGRISLTDFYARRARRILPAAALTLVGISIASWFAFGYVRLHQVLNDVIWAAFFGANIDAARSGTDYFSADGFVSPVQHFWSLSVEEQFYLFWPALIAGVLLLAGRRRLRALTLTLLAVCAVSLVWCAQQSLTSPTAAYFSTFTRLWELGAGALLALVATQLRQLTIRFLTVLSWVGLALIAWACVTYSSTTVFPGRAAMVPVLGAVLVLLGGIRNTPYGASWLLDRAPARKLGDISYSLYLVHWPMLVIPAMATGHEPTVVRKIALVWLAVTVAAISYRWVETPFREAGFWQRHRISSLALWPAAVAFVMVGVAAVGQVGIAASENRPATHAVLDATSDSAALTSGPVTGATTPAPAPAQTDAAAADVRLAMSRAAARSTSATRLPTRLTPSLTDLQNANWSLPRQCWASTTQTQHEICTLGDVDATRTMVLFGDSHMAMWSGPIISLAQTAGWKVVLFVKPGCAPTDTPLWRPELHRQFHECDAWRTWAFQNIARLHPDRVITTGYTRQVVADPKTGDPLRGSQGSAGTAAQARGMRSALAKLTAASPQVTVLGDTTTLPAAAIDCLGKKGATLRTCAVPLNRVTAARNAAWSRATQDAGGQWIDTAAWLCPDNICPLVVGNVVVYTDRQHLTRTFAQSMAPVLAEALKL